MTQLRIHAYAKLNLVLRVVGRRADGYHLLQSLVCAVDVADELELSLLPTGIELHAPAELGPVAGNLAYRAARALLGAGAPGLRIVLRKGIPAGAGLGGGSSDAAAVLAGANELLSLGKSAEELRAVGATLGADVPFFLGPSPAWVEGIGEVITPADVPLPAAFLIVVPPFRCLTSDVYRAFDDLDLPLSVPRQPAHLLTAGPRARPNPGPDGTSSPPCPSSVRWDLAAGNVAFENDLWPAAVHLYPQLVTVRAMLEEVAPLGVGMTGSGSALFGAFPSRAAAAAAREELLSRVDGELLVAAPIGWGYRIGR